MRGLERIYESHLNGIARELDPKSLDRTRTDAERIVGIQQVSLLHGGTAPSEDQHIPTGPLWLNLRRDPQHGDAKQKPMDRGFIALLLLTSATGLALLAWRDSAAMGLLLAVHLGVVMALFLTLPYGKFAHGVFRSAALLKFSIEKRLPNRLQLGSD